jgi:hypothetical protein
MDKDEHGSPREAEWEKHGVDAISADLDQGGFRLVGGPPETRQQAREWVAKKRAEKEAREAMTTVAIASSSGDIAQDAKRAVYLAMEQLVRMGKRLSAHTVPVGATQLLIAYGRGTVRHPEASAAVKEAIVVLARDGKIEAHSDPWKDWIILEPLDMPAPPSTKVFLVHGHDEGARESVARFLEKCGFEVVILHEQVSSGRTIVEKIEIHADAAFAVVLLTPDDVGGSANPGSPQHPRARQNVILELGYFMGKLGRARVCALKKDNVEIPSDFSGVLYIDFDANSGWKMKLAREIHHAGLPIDMTKAASA